MKNKRSKVKIVVLAVLFAVLFSVPFIIKKPVKTIRAKYTAFEDKTEFKGIYFSQESVLYKGETKNLGIKYKRGERIPKDALICNGVYAVQPGIINTYIDGYENKYDLSNIKKITLDDINDVIKNSKETSGIKIINNSELYICANVKEDIKLNKGKAAEIIVENIHYGAEVIDRFKNDDGTFLILRMKNDIDIKSLHRGITGYIINSRYEGIVVPEKAVLNENGRAVVLVKSGGYAEPREVKILYRGRGVAVVIPEPKAKRQLEEYDDVICDTTGLYSGAKVN